MSWNPNEPGNYAWLTKQASEHGGVEDYLDDIESKGKTEGTIEGGIIGVVGAFALVGIIKLTEYIKNKVKENQLKAEIAETKIKEIYYSQNESDDNDKDKESTMNDL